ncbi:FAD-dependent oxidoreductase [Pseudorhodoferax sp.]|uniref:FAD-dependent oxidoreductase n=1 Tax=Pseudorhodoferax sp. TaxID=1993553 RepID=UPI002DD62CB9|nr:FAD-dependent oxidoreductase [Pseudorhodoferax sp.]
MKRREWLQAGLGSLTGLGALPGCSVEAPPATLPPGAWVGTAHERGHRLRTPTAAAPTGTPRKAAVLVLGAGIAGLAAARGFLRAGVDDVQVLELEDSPGGNSRGHRMGGLACPLGAHYLPLPGAAAHEVSEWLHELGLLRQHLGRTVADERHLCHSPQERLFFEGSWHEGLLPPAEPQSATMAQYRRFAARVAAAPRFTIPMHRSAWTAEHATLDGQTFATWLDGHGLDDPRLRWYLDYCCRDDYGAGINTVSAWAGLHYFASRHGFHAPGSEGGERDAVFTWPEGNAWLVQHLTAALEGRIHGKRVVTQVSEQRHGVQVQVLHGDTAESWTAGTVVLALPLWISRRVLQAPPPALLQATQGLVQAPWLVANLQLDRPLLPRPGLPAAWDSVAYGSRWLGYVDAMHQSLHAQPGATVLTAYTPLPVAERPTLLDLPRDEWARRVLAEYTPLHPDLPQRVQRLDLMRYGHAMAVPVPGLAHTAAARRALRGGHGRVRFAHADLAGYSVFEEAFVAGSDAARAPCRCA